MDLLTGGMGGIGSGAMDLLGGLGNMFNIGLGGNNRCPLPPPPLLVLHQVI